jgi:hypothetical protein
VLLARRSTHTQCNHSRPAIQRPANAPGCACEERAVRMAAERKRVAGGSFVSEGRTGPGLDAALGQPHV